MQLLYAGMMFSHGKYIFIMQWDYYDVTWASDT